MQKISEQVVEKIKRLLPAKFGIILDGWSEGGTHFVGVFASYRNIEDPMADKHGNCRVLLSMAPLLDERSFTAEEHLHYIKYVLEIYGKTIENIAYLVGDNCSTNRSLSDLSKVPLIGCYSHKLNLAVQVHTPTVSLFLVISRVF